MFKSKRTAQDFAEEIKAHLELEADDLRGEGLSEAEAPAAPVLNSAARSQRRNIFT